MNKFLTDYRFGDVLSIKHGFAFKGEHFSSQGKYILLTPGNFYEKGGFKYTPGKEKYYSGSFPKEYICSKGDLVVAMTEQSDGLLGSTAIVPVDDVYLHNQRIGLITFDESKVDKYYLYYLFGTKSVRQQIKGSASGTKVKHTSPERIYDVQVKLPPLSHQRRVGRILYDLDTKIELNNIIASTLEEAAKFIYRYWFVQYEYPTDDGMPYKSSGGALIYNKLIKGYMPASWEAKSLYDIATFTNGIPCQKYRPKDREEFLNVIKIREMSDGFSDSTERVSTSIPDKVKITNGDVLFSWSASLEVILWGGGEGALNQHIFKVTSSAYPKSFYYFKLLDYLKHFKMLAENRKTTMGHITIEHLQQAIIPVPPRELAERLDNVLSPILSQVIKRKAENKSLLELRDWLLPMLMNGQVKVNANSDIYLNVTSIHKQAETALTAAVE